ncbi:hypothetical protein WJX81_003734 [Elliptochloris bilobata]|uniref:HTH OST-type domain-containing protein n=1 Tax=Elliptochloris bilobata TaxID=381761 RepID=A0AAW1SIP0_9CHLO
MDLQGVATSQGGSRPVNMPPPACPPGPLEHQASEIKVVEVDAFCSVQDMIHAAIASYGAQASLREIYRACEKRGRIAYKRSGGSRFITHNDHWKSQIRHALYTGDRFVRAAEGADSWMVAKAFARVVPASTKVLVRTDAGAGAVNGGLAPSGGGGGVGGAAAGSGGGGGAHRMTRSKQNLGPPPLALSPRRKRSRPARQVARLKGSAAAANGDAADDDEDDEQEDGTGDGRASGDLRGWRSSATEEDENAGGPALDSVASGAGYHSSPFFRSGRGDDGVAATHCPEGVDESSHPERLPLRSSRGGGPAYKRRSLLAAAEAEREPAHSSMALSHAGAALGVPPAGPIGRIRTRWASARGGSGGGGGGARMGGLAWGPRTTGPPGEGGHGGTMSGGEAEEVGLPIARARSAEAESPPTTQLYALRSRACPHRSPPGFGAHPDPAAAAAAEHAASAELGPIKSRLKAAAKAAAAAEAASAARAARDESCSAPSADGGTGTGDGTSGGGSGSGAATAQGDALRPRRRPAVVAAARPGPDSPFGPRGGGTPPLDTRKRGRGRGLKLIDQVTRCPTHGAAASGSLPPPPTPSATAPRAPGPTSCSTTPAATPSLTPPPAATAAVQGAASSAAAAAQAGALLAFGEALSDDGAEGADESDDGGARRMLRSHAAAAVAAAAAAAAAVGASGLSDANHKQAVVQGPPSQGFLVPTSKAVGGAPAAALLVDTRQRAKKP